MPFSNPRDSYRNQIVSLDPVTYFVHTYLVESNSMEKKHRYLTVFVLCETSSRSYPYSPLFLLTTCKFFIKNSVSVPDFLLKFTFHTNETFRTWGTCKSLKLPCTYEENF